MKYFFINLKFTIIKWLSITFNLPIKIFSQKRRRKNHAN